MIAALLALASWLLDVPDDFFDTYDIDVELDETDLP